MAFSRSDVVIIVVILGCVVNALILSSLVSSTGGDGLGSDVHLVKDLNRRLDALKINAQAVVPGDGRIDDELNAMGELLASLRRDMQTLNRGSGVAAAALEATRITRDVPTEKPPIEQVRLADFRDCSMREEGAKPNGTLNDGPRGKRHLHHHIQHHAGTMLYDIAIRDNKECAVRACHYSRNECLFSVNEEVEVQRLRGTGHTYVSYEVMLPPNFPFPFVRHREEFFFTTVLRNPLDRMLSLSHDLHTTKLYPEVQKGNFDTLVFKQDFSLHPYPGGYPHDNFMLRWISGIPSPDPLTRQDLMRAKCRLNGYDIVVVDKWINEMVKGMLCDKSKWRWWCHPGRFHGPKDNRTARGRIGDPTLFGIVLERHRMDFELYDHGLRLAAKQMVAYGIRDREPELPESTYIEAAMQALDLSPKAQKGFTDDIILQQTRDLRVNNVNSLEEFCLRMHAEWARNEDKAPVVLGGLLRGGFEDPKPRR
eukprot:TRINITY_DN112885_c0_g1_i1.p1 TRINITY_DN112885_c0_g1~~TRINITY_DN112885_c0_g1_i1.p1  ORF type:complete len:481 (+),score=98.95 TRINITY_DN112885_c0_g1_i1:79-1521(+)